MRLGLMYGFILIGLTGCQSDAAKLEKLETAESNKARYCQSKYSRFGKKSYERQMIECIETASDWDIKEYNLQIMRFKAQQEENRKSIIDLKAQKELSLIEANIRAYPRKESVKSNKLQFCRTNPEWRKHGVLVAQELNADRRLKPKTTFEAKIKNEYLRSSIVLSCFKSTSTEQVEEFYLPREQKMQEDLENAMRSLKEKQ